MNEKKAALVIGGSGGIGFAVVKKFADSGMKVYATYRSENERLEEIKDKLKDTPNCSLIRCDLLKEQDVNSAVDQIINAGFKLGVVVNTATSRLKLRTFENLSDDDFLEDIQTIILGSINLFRKVIPLMKKNKSGIIVNFLSSTVINPVARMSSYITAKSGLLGLSRSLAEELRPFNVKMVNLSPSFVETTLINDFPQKLLELEKEKLPDKQFIQPADMADLIFEIVKCNAEFISGNIILNSKNEIRDLIQKISLNHNL